MEFIKPGINIDFIGKRKIALCFSLTLIFLTVILLIWRQGPNYGVDFTGGVLIQVKLAEKESPADIRKALEPIQLQDSIIQEFGERGHAEYLIRVRKTDIELSGLDEKVKKALEDHFGKEADIRRVEMVGPKVGKDLRQKALFAIFYSILFIAIYISGRFEHQWLMSIIMAISLAIVVYVASGFGVSVTWLILLALLVTLGLCWFLRLKYALGAIIALIHDVTITVGAFAITDREISLSIIAAFLTIVGYSLNDTIVVFDRIRENLGRYRRRSFEEIMNSSINETLSRTILTSSTTLVVVIALFILGGGVIHDFAFALLVGIVIGTYSSIFVASPILLVWQGRFSESSKIKKGLVRTGR
ncbi:MAG: protein translocase subunit SecF [Deltaproteobacteria bacterium]|nr:protein translocase subunit SecF [Deltaproteobacteria bacterium]MBW2015851.1 protein translocase subunit SecF [Deltaproteobacteria bacterium]MBW2128990.1 protein translocase subunit SecF [Deltaproteobacteria bacterium]MBW2302915.1 protein translocase subunit SecF [Deltaproteobacteria bacterium]